MATDELTEEYGDYLVYNSDTETYTMKYPISDNQAAKELIGGIDDSEIARDYSGYTHPNLHRRIYEPYQIWKDENGYAGKEDTSELFGEFLSYLEDERAKIDEDLSDDELKSMYGYTYTLKISGVNSYRHTEMYVHNEESTTSEIP